ncbi:unnamed protein product [Effrenium voratum]|nr:unnamed protein product [Effrenium voratum]
MSGQEPTEHVSCGRCSCVNSVPFGLDVFKCYKCGVAVVISRESSAACAAASPTALYLDGLQAPSSAPSSSSKSSRSFFEKLQRQVDKTLQKVEQSFFDGSSAAAAPAKTLPVGKPLESEAAGYAQSQDAQLKVAEAWEHRRSGARHETTREWPVFTRRSHGMHLQLSHAGL